VNDPPPGFLSRSSVSESMGGGPLTREIFERAIEELLRPTNIEHLRVVTLAERPQWGGFITRSTIEDLPPNPLYLELFG
jgi:hypothetical protein